MRYSLKESLFISLLGALCCIVGLVIGNVAPLNKPKQPIIIYQVDNAGGLMLGKVTDKEIIEGRYTVTAHGYGKFLVTKEQYDSLSVGDEIPDFLKKRGS
ncbi:TPA: DUF1372 family protein [Streptococcus agalactiae]|uniref:DUF1372 family protein n=1 Tax=Streptococcus TaxID=1301 RepID=UPI0002BAB14B|nr:MULTISPECIES: DUF1372 family protein [Streptococcus]EPU85064.1 hypothetical protein SAG0317_02920 [Streptococcus agalactiae GB00219]EPV23764.1 hypothetical protein SAG0335_05520 [Streptococcus agalactiae GB00651]EPV98055.1 hypothetical protein SAG0039_05975 [Streptococcus agalactiae FSL S3-014]EPW02632.1 hypothetical protein SAG0043_07015 [Streptococcus agalactiae FSL S3-137]EPW58493.1 hypothetical protein SAG0086_06890 [Streptococcus agalactiae LMG 15090]